MTIIPYFTGDNREQELEQALIDISLELVSALNAINEFNSPAITRSKIEFALRTIKAVL